MTSTSILSRGFRLLTGALPRPTVPAVNKVSANLTSVRNYAKKGKKKGGPQGDPRVRMIRYYLFHPAKHTPRPLKFGTMRMLRHWTIHRAWQLVKRKERQARHDELQRQYDSIREAVEELGRTDERLQRIALSKKGQGTFPIELRIPTDTPAIKGWNAKWKRA